MKYVLGMVIFIATAAGAALAQCNERERMALQAFDTEWGKAGLGGDKAALTAIYADDYTGLPAMETKTVTIENTMRAFERSQANPAMANKTIYDRYIVSCTPSTATVTHRNTVWTPNGTGGKPGTSYTRSVHFLEKRNGKWQVVSSAGHPLDDAGVVWYLEQDWNDAVLKKDRAWFEKTYASDFSSVDSTTGKLSYKADAIADDTDAKLTMEAVETTDMNVRVDGNTAVVTGVFRTKGKNDKGPFDRKIRFTDTWIKRDGRWQAWASQGTIIP